MDKRNRAYQVLETSLGTLIPIDGNFVGFGTWPRTIGSNLDFLDLVIRKEFMCLKVSSLANLEHFYLL